MLASFEKITQHISGATYSTFSMIHPYIEILKRSFAPRLDKEETKTLYLELVYNCTLNDDNSTDLSSDSISDDNDIPSNNINMVEYLSSVNPDSLLQKVHATIFLSLDELWDILSDLALIASILDPQFKTFYSAFNKKGRSRNRSLKQERESAAERKENSYTWNGDSKIKATNKLDASPTHEDMAQSMLLQIIGRLDKLEGQDSLSHIISARMILRITPKGAPDATMKPLETNEGVESKGEVVSPENE
ncbi:27981_t:CDS:2, partial [Dentiscutata erythropus]